MLSNRAASVYLSHGIIIEPEYIASELKICHEEICPLRLHDMMNGEVDDLMHDISGIHRYMDILDGSFWECWKPRFAR